MLQLELLDVWRSFGVSTLAVPNNVDLTINLVNGNSCYVTS